MKVIARNIKDYPVKIFNPDGTLLCETDNILVFYDIRIQIKKHKLEGYYLEFNGEIINIDKEGDPEQWPNGLFDISDKQLDCLLDMRDKPPYKRNDYDNIQGKELLPIRRKKTEIVLIVDPKIYPEKGVKLDYIPNMGDWVHYNENNYYAKRVIHNLDERKIKVFVDANEAYKRDPLAHLK